MQIVPTKEKWYQQNNTVYVIQNFKVGQFMKDEKKGGREREREREMTEKEKKKEFSLIWK